MKNIGIYIHIPFCLKKCYYCDFSSYVGLEGFFKTYAENLCKEIGLVAPYFAKDYKIDSIYIGGGTPSIFHFKSLKNIINTLSRFFTINSDLEFTIEANPGTVNLEKFQNYKNLGINRISFGIQAFNDSLLKEIGRIHSKEEGIRTILEAREAGFDNISIDLMYGLPDQTLNTFKDSLDNAIQLKVDHISVYGLKIEENTSFRKMQLENSLLLPDEETEEKMYDLMTEYLPNNSYHRYEISNFALTSKESRHNLKYWRYQPYIGFGVAAHSFINEKRTANSPNLLTYLKNIRLEDISILKEQEEDLDIRQKKAEFIFLALRTAQGLYYQDFEKLFQSSFLEEYKDVITNLVNLKLIDTYKDRAFLTTQGFKLSNQIFERFLPDL